MQHNSMIRPRGGPLSSAISAGRIGRRISPMVSAVLAGDSGDVASFYFRSWHIFTERLSGRRVRLQSYIHRT